MSRIRSVHPSLFTDEAWVSCCPLARILYIGLWTDADDQGVFVWKPLQIKMRLLPGDVADAGALLDELEAASLIARFEADGSLYGAIRNFRKFQRPQKPNAIHPITEAIASYVYLSATSRVAVRDQSATPTGTAQQMEDGGCRMEDNRKPSVSCPPQAANHSLAPSDFDRFWQAYPSKVGKKAAQRAWAKAKDRPPLADVLAAIEAYRKAKPVDRDWCHPATWLSQGRWDDVHNSGGLRIHPRTGLPIEPSWAG